MMIIENVYKALVGKSEYLKQFVKQIDKCIHRIVLERDLKQESYILYCHLI